MTQSAGTENVALLRGEPSLADEPTGTEMVFVSAATAGSATTVARARGALRISRLSRPWLAAGALRNSRLGESLRAWLAAQSATRRSDGGIIVAAVVAVLLHPCLRLKAARAAKRAKSKARAELAAVRH